MNRRIFPLYVVVFVGFLGYSLMIATFTDDRQRLARRCAVTTRPASDDGAVQHARNGTAHGLHRDPESTGALWFTLGATALALAICLPSCAAMLSLAASDQEQGRAMGNNQSMQVGAEALSGLAGRALAAILITFSLLVFAGSESPSP